MFSSVSFVVRVTAASFGGVVSDGCAWLSSDSCEVVFTQHLLVAKDAGRKPRAFRKRGKQKFLTGQKFYQNPFNGPFTLLRRASLSWYTRVFLVKLNCNKRYNIHCRFLAYTSKLNFYAKLSSQMKQYMVKSPQRYCN